MPEGLEIEHIDQGILGLRGPLVTENVNSFLNAVRREITPTIILDFSEVPYLDSSGLGSLVSAYTSFQKMGRRVALTGVNPRVLKVFEITKTDSIFLMFDSVASALEALTNAGTA